MDVWEKVWAPLIVAAIAVLWPWLLTLQRGWRFRRLIKRELAELGPYPSLSDVDREGAPRTMSLKTSAEQPWWEYVTKSFVHEATFRTAEVPENRDFILTLNPTLVYQVSQLWIALEKRDGGQWKHYLSELSKNRSVRSDKLAESASQWKAIVDAQPAKWQGTMGIPTPFRQEAALQRTAPLFEKRLESYAKLLPHLDVGSEEQPRSLSPSECAELENKLKEWFYDGGSGLLLSGRAFHQFQVVRRQLRKQPHEPGYDPTSIAKQASGLRTDLKIDLGVRQPQERHVDDAWPEDERW